MTFRGAVEKVREIIGDGKEIAFAHEVTFMNGSHHISDVKDELINRANDLRLEAAE
jgi:CO dehydrogenase/acetyl-CoA synthase gamma subunit (corrinoid Fe-S protein)